MSTSSPNVVDLALIEQIPARLASMVGKNDPRTPFCGERPLLLTK
jgi:hypothetical protein